MAAGLPAEVFMADTRMFVSSTTRIYWACSLVRRLGTDFAHGLVDDALDFIRVGAGVALPDCPDSALKDAPADGILDEFREVAFLHSQGAQEGTQG
jgi:hypothetical protein